MRQKPRRNRDAIIPYQERILLLAKILYNETDKDNPVTLTELLDVLDTAYGRGAKRTTLQADIKAISETLFPIEYYYMQDHGFGYYRKDGDK